MKQNDQLPATQHLQFVLPLPESHGFVCGEKSEGFPILALSILEVIKALTVLSAADNNIVFLN